MLKKLVSSPDFVKIVKVCYIFWWLLWVPHSWTCPWPSWQQPVPCLPLCGPSPLLIDQWNERRCLYCMRLRAAPCIHTTPWLSAAPPALACDSPTANRNKLSSLWGAGSSPLTSHTRRRSPLVWPENWLISVSCVGCDIGRRSLQIRLSWSPLSPWKPLPRQIILVRSIRNFLTFLKYTSK